MVRSKKIQGTYEKHEHSYISGPNAHFSPVRTVTHSHDDGSCGHNHPDTGPATFTVDKDAMFRATGIAWGGRKVYTAKPSGPQLPWVELEDWQKRMKVVFCDTGYTAEHERSGVKEEDYNRVRAEFQAAAAGEPLPEVEEGYDPHGQAGLAVARMALTFDLDVEYEYHDRRASRPSEAAG